MTRIRKSTECSSKRSWSMEMNQPLFSSIAPHMYVYGDTDKYSQTMTAEDVGYCT